MTMIARNGLLALLAIAAIAALPIAGCGDDDSTTSTTEASEAQEENEGGTTAAEGEGAGEGATLEIKMGDYFFDPENAIAQQGTTTIDAPNEGKVEHELVVFKSNLDPAKLPTDSSGEVDEEKLEQEGAEEAGEIEDVEAGESKSREFDLPPGKYVMFCNLPGHYERGMYGTITVE
jgi:uncharacterized cupredoxin-like copper-binding protein